MEANDSFHRAAERRIEVLIVALGAAGALAAAVGWGWRFAAGVAVGAVLGWLNFRWIRQSVEAMVAASTAEAGSDRARVPRSVYLKLFGGFALLLLVVYAILSRPVLPAVAVLTGVFSLIAAVLLELVFELFRGKPGREPGP